MDKFKDVTIEGREYRIGLFSAAVGSMIMLQVPHMLTNEEMFFSVRANCLNVCHVIRNVNDVLVPMKMFDKGSGKWLLPDVPELDAGSNNQTDDGSCQF